MQQLLLLLLVKDSQAIGHLGERNSGCGHLFIARQFCCKSDGTGIFRGKPEALEPGGQTSPKSIRSLIFAKGITVKPETRRKNVASPKLVSVILLELKNPPKLFISE